MGHACRPNTRSTPKWRARWLNRRSPPSRPTTVGTWPDFTAMRQLAMRFRGILRSRDIGRLAVWLNDTHQSGNYAVRHFVRTLRQDIDAVTNALMERWSNGQTEGQINRLKTLK